MPRPHAPAPFSASWRGIELEGTAVFYPGRPGVYSGPPEKCYPDEPPELDIHTLTCEGKDAMFLLDSTLDEEIRKLSSIPSAWNPMALSTSPRSPRMSNRTKILERSSVAVHADCLEALLDSCRRNGRLAKLPVKEEKIFFDAERFRWWFKNRDGRTLQQWRDLIDAEMRKEL